MNTTAATYIAEPTYRPWRRSSRSGYLAWGGLVGAAWASAMVLMLLLAASVHAPTAGLLERTGSSVVLASAPLPPGLDRAAVIPYAVVGLAWVSTAAIISVCVALARPTPATGSRLLAAGAGLAAGCAVLPLVAALIG